MENNVLGKSKNPTPIFVATNLDFLEGNSDDPNLLHYRDGLEYRRLTPGYLAWMSKCVKRCGKLAKAGEVDVEIHHRLTSQLEIITQLATERYSTSELATAKPIKIVVPVAQAPISSPEPISNVQAPSTIPNELSQPQEPTEELFRFPSEGTFQFHEKVSHTSVGMVDAIREQTIQLGWTEAQLYQNRGNIVFPCGRDWGLICFLHDEKKIVEITSQYIALLNRCGQITRFYNHPVNHVTGGKP